MQGIRSDEGTLATSCVDSVYLLDFDAILADYARPGLHGVERAGGATGVFDEQEADGFAVRRPGELLHVAGEMGELANGAGDLRPEIDLLLTGHGRVGGGSGAGAEEGEGAAIVRPDGIGVGAVGGVGYGYGLGLGFGPAHLGELEDGAITAAERPGDQLAVGRESHRAWGCHAPAVGRGGPAAVTLHLPLVLWSIAGDRVFRAARGLRRNGLLCRERLAG